MLKMRTPVREIVVYEHQLLRYEAGPQILAAIEKKGEWKGKCPCCESHDVTIFRCDDA